MNESKISYLETFPEGATEAQRRSHSYRSKSHSSLAEQSTGPSAHFPARFLQTGDIHISVQMKILNILIYKWREFLSVGLIFNIRKLILNTLGKFIKNNNILHGAVS